jgi:hypothetical protein
VGPDGDDASPPAASDVRTAGPNRMGNGVRTMSALPSSAV